MIAPASMPPEQGAVIEAIYLSRRGWIVADSVSPPVVVTLIDERWVAWWPGKSRITFTPEGAKALGVKLDQRGRWTPAVKGQRPVFQKPHRHEMNATSAGLNMNEVPDGHQPTDDGRYRRPTILVGLTPTWQGPRISECPSCGNVPYRNGKPYCLICDGEPLTRVSRVQSA